MAKILIVEDNEELATIVKLELIVQKYTVEWVDNGATALELMLGCDFDLVILDIELPEMDGYEICSRYRAAGHKTPVLMLTGRSEINDKTSGLDCGADDYLTKPFDGRELNARLRALLRRTGSSASNVLCVGDITLNMESREIKLKGEPVKLMPKEFALLEFFMMNPNKVYSPEALLSKVWQSDKDVSLSTVYTTIKTLRHKISGAGDAVLETVHGAGYKLRA